MSQTHRWYFHIIQERMPRSNVVKIRVHKVVEFYTIAAFSCLWTRSTMLLGEEWYAVFLKQFVPNNWFNSLNKCDSNCFPWWAVMRRGVSNRAIQLSYKARATVGASSLIIGIASGYLEKEFTIVRHMMVKRMCRSVTWRACWFFGIECNCEPI